MSFFNKYPYSDMHELNLDWLITKMKELNIAFDEFKVINQITFSGVWDITEQYPAWTIVSDNNIGYVSIQPVPAGVLLTNGDYWREVIDYTAQIAGLQSRVVDLENHDIIVDGQITAINTKIDNIDKKRFIFVSDSYGEQTDDWITQVVNRLNLSAGDYYSAVQGGYGFQPPYPGYFIDLIQSIESSVLNKDTITDIVVVGGFNDRTQTYANISTAIQAFITYCNTTYPDAKIWIGAAGWSFNYEFVTELANGRYIDAYKDSVNHGAYYLKGMDYIMHDKDLFVEQDPGGYTLFLNKLYVHPNASGSAYIASCVIANILGSTFTFNRRKTVTVELASGITEATSTPVTIEQYIVDNKITLKFNSANLQFSPVHASNSGLQWVELGTIREGFVAGASASGIYPGTVKVNALLAGGTITGALTPGFLIGIMNNRIYAKFRCSETFSTLYLLDGLGEIDNIFA